MSAALVLGGVILTSRGLAQEGSLYGPLGVALVAEIYAGALIGAAAILTRIGQRRPAVLLALITVLYQCDLTLHTETCAYLGAVGIMASAVWLLCFAGKLYALAWAVRVRVSPRAAVTALLGALGLSVGPHVLPLVDARASGAMLALFVFALGLCCPRAPLSEACTLRPAVESRVPLDDWGHLVLRRAMQATWICG